MAAPRRMTPQAEAPGVDFGSLGFYSGGFSLADGDYAMEFTVNLFQPSDRTTGAAKGNSFLAVQVMAYPLAGGEPHEQQYSMGGKAKESFMPNASGKGLVAIPGGPGAGLNNLTNWGVFLKSLYDSGLPDGVFTNDLSVLDGIHVHTSQVPEPAERKSYQTMTGEAQQEQRDRKIAIVTEIKPDGMPWEGTGGIPEAGAAPKAASKAPVPIARPAAARAAAAPAASEVDEETLESEALNHFAAALGDKKKLTKNELKRDVFKAAGSGDLATQIINTYFAADEVTALMLDRLGYNLSGVLVTVRA